VANKHLASLLTTDWQRERQAFVYLYLILLFVLPTSFLRIPKTHNRTSLQVWHTNVLHFCSFCKPTFSRATRNWDALYNAHFYVSVVIPTLWWNIDWKVTCVRYVWKHGIKHRCRVYGSSTYVLWSFFLPVYAHVTPQGQFCNRSVIDMLTFKAGYSTGLLVRWTEVRHSWAICQWFLVG
jgi:hypothetical protein